MATDTARHEHSATWTGANGKMIVFGGIGGVNWLGDVNWLTASSQYDPTGDAWSPLQPNGVSGEPVARARHTAVWTDTELLVWGGTTGGNTVLGNGAKFKVQETSWTPMNEPSPAPREYHTAVWLGSKMLVWGGLTTNGVRLDSGATFDPLTNKWDPKPLPTAPLARAFHTGLATDKAMIVWGGETANGFTNTGGIYTP
jgi:N-acetylneuraminic acid mutarotase